MMRRMTRTCAIELWSRVGCEAQRRMISLSGKHSVVNRNLCLAPARLGKFYYFQWGVETSLYVTVCKDIPT